MFRFLIVLAVVGTVCYRVIYGQKEKPVPNPQTTNQPLVNKVQRKPSVLFGEPLTDLEWEQIQQSDRFYLN